MLFYNLPKHLKDSRSCHDIVLEVENEDPEKCIDLCHQRTQIIVNPEKINTEDESTFDNQVSVKEKSLNYFAFSYILNHNLINFDLCKFLRNNANFRNLYANKVKMHINALKNQILELMYIIPLELNISSRVELYKNF